MSTTNRSTSTPVTRRSFIEEVPGDWVAVQLGYTGTRCLLEDHRRYPAANYLRRTEDEAVLYRCWPCDVYLNAFDLLKASIERSDFDGDVDEETLQRAEILAKEWLTVEGWESDDSLFDQGGSATTYDLRSRDSGWDPPRTEAEMVASLLDAQDPDHFAQSLEKYREERRWFHKPFDSFHQVPAKFLADEFGWGANIHDTLVIPLRSEDGTLASIRYMNARKKWSERGYPPPTIYGLDRKKDQEKVIIVEGVSDVVRLAWEYKDEQHTVVLGLLSASFSTANIPLDVFRGCDVIILGDGGDAGNQATERLANALTDVASVSIVPLPADYTDVCAYQGDLQELIANAKPRLALQYLERDDVLKTFSKITDGISEVGLQKILSELPPVPTDRLEVALIRRSLAGRLTEAGFLKSVADAWLATAPREDPAFDEVIGTVHERDVQPWPGAVDGEELLNEIAALYRRFVFISNPHAYDVEAAFTVLTYCFLNFMSLPYIHLPSPMPESGKTRNLELLELCCNRAYIFIDPSASVIFRFVEEFHPTLLLDEVDNIFAGRDEDSKQLKAILNAGYTSGKFVPRMAVRPDGSYHTEMFSPFAPKVLAGIRSIPRALRSRCIVIPMKRKLAGEEVEEFDEPVRLDVGRAAGIIRSKILRWVDDQIIAGSFAVRPEFPPGLGDRMRDCWRPLFVIANAVGGDWPGRIRDAAVSLSVKVVVDDEDEIGMLLEDLRDFYDDEDRTSADFEWIQTSALIFHLIGLEHRPWKYLRNEQGISPTKLATLLKVATSGGACPIPKKVNGKVLRGYQYEPIKDSIDRYLGRSDLR